MKGYKRSEHPGDDWMRRRTKGEELSDAGRPQRRATSPPIWTSWGGTAGVWCPLCHSLWGCTPHTAAGRRPSRGPRIHCRTCKHAWEHLGGMLLWDSHTTDKEHQKWEKDGFFVGCWTLWDWIYSQTCPFRWLLICSRHKNRTELNWFYLLAAEKMCLDVWAVSPAADPLWLTGCAFISICILTPFFLGRAFLPPLNFFFSLQQVFSACCPDVLCNDLYYCIFVMWFV